MWTFLLFCVLILLLSLSICFSPTGNNKFLSNDNKIIQAANWMIFLICIGLANVVCLFEFESAFLTWVINFAICVITTVGLFLIVSCAALIWELTQSFRQAMKE